MKNKLIGLFAAIALVIAGALCLTACDGEKPKPEKQLTSITCQVTHERFSDGKFTYYYGDTVQISKSNFEVTARYSDESAQTVTDFTLDTSSLPADTTAIGEYTISVSYGDASPLNYSVAINEKQIDDSVKTYLLSLGTLSVDYTGGTINILDEATELKAFLDEANCPIEIDPSSALSASEVGTYAITFKNKTGYEPYTKSIGWIIKEVIPQIVTIQIPTVKTPSVEYDGQEHGIELVFAQGTPQQAIDSIKIASDNTDGKKYTDAGEYTYYIIIDSDDYIFPDSSKNTTATLTITQKTLAYNQNELAVTSTPTYTGKAITLADLTHNVDTTLFDVSLDDNCIDANENENYPAYCLGVQPKESTTVNYVWKDGTNISGYIGVEFRIRKTTVFPDYSAKAAQILQNVVITKTYGENYTFEQYINSFYLTDDAKNWLAENLDFKSGWEEISLAEEENAITDAEGKSYASDGFAAGDFKVLINYNPNKENYEGNTKIQIKLSVDKKDVTVSNTYWEINDGEQRPLPSSWYTNNLINFYDTITETDYYKAEKDGEYTLIPSPGENVPQHYEKIGYYKNVALHEINLDNYNVIIGENNKSRISLVENGVEFVTEWRIYNPNPQGKAFVFTSSQILKADGSALTDEEKESEALSELVAMAANFDTGNQGKTANCELDGKVSGSCDFGDGTFDELIAGNTPVFYSYSNDKVTMYKNGEDGNPDESSKFVGSLVGDILTLDAVIAEGYIWRLTFEVTGNIPATEPAA